MNRDRMQAYPPTRLRHSIPISLSDAQSRIAAYIDRADELRNTHLHPDAQLTPSGINRSSHGGAAGGLIISHLRRLAQGMAGERIEIDPKLLDDPFNEEDGQKKEKQSEDSRLDAAIAAGGYGKKSKGKKGGRDAEGWQSMESYQQEFEEEGEAEKEGKWDLDPDRGRMANEPEIQDVEPSRSIEDSTAKAQDDARVEKALEVGEEAGLETGKKKKRKRVEKSLEVGEEVGKEIGIKKKRKRDEEAKMNGNAELNGKNGNEAKKTRTDATQWSFDQLKTQDKDVVAQHNDEEHRLETKESKPKSSKKKANKSRNVNHIEMNPILLNSLKAKPPQAVDG